MQETATPQKFHFKNTVGLKAQTTHIILFEVTVVLQGRVLFIKLQEK